MRAKWVMLASAIAVVALGWTGLWVYARGFVAARIDPQLADLAATRGITVACTGRSIAGWPFRLEVLCDGLRIDMPDGQHVQAAAASAIASIDDLNLLRFAVKAPLSVTLPDGRKLEGEFTNLEASLRLTDHKPDRLSIVADDLTGSLGDGDLVAARFAAKHAELHLRPRPDRPDDLDIAASFDAGNATVASVDAFPLASEGSVNATLVGAGAMARGTRPADWLMHGGKVDLQAVALKIGDVVFNGDGALAADSQGEASGKLTVVGANVQQLTGLAKSGKQLSPVLTTLGTAFLIFGAPVDGGRRIDVIADGGAITANGLKLGKLPPLVRMN